jgi:tetratricopeptide (TPR) repeat protein
MRIAIESTHGSPHSAFKGPALVLVFLMLAFIPPATSRAGESEVVNLVREGQKLFAADDLSGAEVKCREALRINARYFPAYNLLGGIYSVQPGKEKNGVMYFSKSLEVNPSQATIYVKLAFLHNKHAEFDESIAVLNRGLARYKDDYYINYNLGLIYMLEKNDPEKALEYLRVSERREMVDTKLIYVEGVAYMFRKDTAKALEMVTRLRKGGDEYLAAHLEDMIRRTGRGETVNPIEVARVFNRQSGTRVVGGAQEEVYPAKKRSEEAPKPEPARVKARITARGTPMKAPVTK